MILLFHILVASTSVLVAGLAFFFPSKTKLNITYGLVGMTLATGTYLVFTIPATHITQTCLVGLAYTGLVSVSIVATRHKLAKSSV